MEEVLRELESQDKPRLYVMNKVDLLPEKKRESLRDTDSVIHVSAHERRWASTGCWSASTQMIAAGSGAAACVCACRSRKAKPWRRSMPRRWCCRREYRDGYVELEVQAPESLLRQVKSFRYRQVSCNTYWPSSSVLVMQE